MVCGVSSIILGLLSAVVLGELPTPGNVTIDSVNLKHILKWNSIPFHDERVTYSVQYQGLFERRNDQNWTEAENCTNITETECNLLEYLAFIATYFIRVRAERGNQTSEWIEANAFSPYRDSVIGPAMVQVESLLGQLQVSVFDPVTEEGTSMQMMYPDLAYWVFYWKDTEDTKVYNKSFTGVTVLSELQPWTTYCLRVQSYIKNPFRLGQSSSILCNQTSANAKTRALKAASFLFVSLFSVLLVTVGCFAFLFFVHRTIKRIMYPSYSFPSHIREYLTEPSQQSIFAALDKEELHEDHWDKLSIVSRSEITTVLIVTKLDHKSFSNTADTQPEGNTEEDLDSNQSSVDSGHFSSGTDTSFQKNSQIHENIIKR
uniref:Interleukin-10 receptor subunit beta n=1 Tax=Callorhinchus milii TaxID=7868 RepID=V9KWB3_CALMI